MENPESQENLDENRDEMIIKQKLKIEQEIAENAPLISDMLKMDTLNHEYSDDPIYLSKVKDLSTKYQGIRKVRPDGNCFFRGFAYACLEFLINSKPDYEKFKELATESKAKLVKLGFPQFTIEDFHDTFMEVIQRVQPSDNEENQQTEVLAELHKLFNEQGYSDYVVVYLRLITSGQLQEGADFYQNFIDGNCTMKEFCHQEVEPMYKESDHIHIIAICTALNIGVRVEYMDRSSETQGVVAHDFPDGLKPKIFLLYRPSHYDVLYPNADN